MREVTDSVWVQGLGLLYTTGIAVNSSQAKVHFFSDLLLVIVLIVCCCECAQDYLHINLTHFVSFDCTAR